MRSSQQETTRPSPVVANDANTSPNAPAEGKARSPASALPNASGIAIEASLFRGPPCLAPMGGGDGAERTRVGEAVSGAELHNGSPQTTATSAAPPRRDRKKPPPLVVSMTPMMSAVPSQCASTTLPHPDSAAMAQHLLHQQQQHLPQHEHLESMPSFAPIGTPVMSGGPLLVAATDSFALGGIAGSSVTQGSTRAMGPMSFAFNASSVGAILGSPSRLHRDTVARFSDDRETLQVGPFFVNRTGCVSNQNVLLMNASVSDHARVGVDASSTGSGGGTTGSGGPSGAAVGGHGVGGRVPSLRPPLIIPDATPPLKSTNMEEPLSPIYYIGDEVRRLGLSFAGHPASSGPVGGGGPPSVGNGSGNLGSAASGGGVGSGSGGPGVVAGAGNAGSGAFGASASFGNGSCGSLTPSADAAVSTPLVHHAPGGLRSPPAVLPRAPLQRGESAHTLSAQAVLVAVNLQLDMQLLAEQQQQHQQQQQQQHSQQPQQQHHHNHMMHQLPLQSPWKLPSPMLKPRSPDVLPPPPMMGSSSTPEVCTGGTALKTPEGSSSSASPDTVAGAAGGTGLVPGQSPPTTRWSPPMVPQNSRSTPPMGTATPLTAFAGPSSSGGGQGRPVLAPLVLSEESSPRLGARLSGSGVSGTPMVGSTTSGGVAAETSPTSGAWLGASAAQSSSSVRHRTSCVMNHSVAAGCHGSGYVASPPKLDRTPLRPNVLAGVEGARSQVALDDLRLRRIVGVGASGVTYKAEHTVTKTSFAVKQMDLSPLIEDAARRENFMDCASMTPFERPTEARIKQLNSIVHRELLMLHCNYRSPHVVKTYDAFFGMDGSPALLHIVMEYMDFGTLEDVGYLIASAPGTQAPRDGGGAAPAAVAAVASPHMQHPQQQQRTGFGTDRCIVAPLALAAAEAFEEPFVSLSPQSASGATPAVVGGTTPPLSISEAASVGETSLTPSAPLIAFVRGSTVGAPPLLSPRSVEGANAAPVPTNNSADASLLPSPQAQHVSTHGHHASVLPIPSFAMSLSLADVTLGDSRTGHSLSGHLSRSGLFDGSTTSIARGSDGATPTHGASTATEAPAGCSAIVAVSTAFDIGSESVSPAMGSGRQLSAGSPEQSLDGAGRGVSPSRQTPQGPAKKPPRPQRKRAPLCERVIAVIAEQALRGLRDMHERGHVHRDIKPSNLLVNRRGIVKISDFGLAEAVALPSHHQRQQQQQHHHHHQQHHHTAASSHSYVPGRDRGSSVCFGSSVSTPHAASLASAAAANAGSSTPLVTSLPLVSTAGAPPSEAAAMTPTILSNMSFFNIGHLNLSPASMHCEDVLEAAAAAAFGDDTEDLGCSGTDRYMSPERLRGESYGTASDVWSIGMTLAECACGYFPIDLSQCAGPFEVLTLISGGPRFPPELDAVLSDKFKDFIRQMTDVDPHARATADALLGHPFLSQWKTPFDFGAYLLEAARERHNARIRQVATAAAQSGGAGGAALRSGAADQAASSVGGANGKGATSSVASTDVAPTSGSVADGATAAAATAAPAATAVPAVAKVAKSEDKTLPRNSSAPFTAGGVLGVTGSSLSSAASSMRDLSAARGARGDGDAGVASGAAAQNAESAPGTIQEQALLLEAGSRRASIGASSPLTEFFRHYRAGSCGSDDVATPPPQV